MRTPFCGKPGCEWPPQDPLRQADARLSRAAERMKRANEELEAAEREHREASEAVNRLLGMGS